MASITENTRLSPHFRWREFRDWHTGALPPTSTHHAVERLCRNVLEPLRARFGVCTVHSGYRTRATNESVGGARHSHHIYTEHQDSPAADVSFARGTPAEWHAAADRLGVGGLGKYPTHIHVDQRSGRSRW